MFTPPEIQLDLAHLRQRELILQRRACECAIDRLVASAARLVARHRKTPRAGDRRVQPA